MVQTPDSSTKSEASLLSPGVTTALPSDMDMGPIASMTAERLSGVRSGARRLALSARAGWGMQKKWAYGFQVSMST